MAKGQPPTVAGSRSIWRNGHSLGGWRTDAPRKPQWGEGFIACLRKPMVQSFGYKQEASVKFPVWNQCIVLRSPRGLSADLPPRIGLCDAMDLPAGTILWFPPGQSGVRVVGQVASHDEWLQWCNQWWGRVHTPEQQVLADWAQTLTLPPIPADAPPWAKRERMHRYGWRAASWIRRAEGSVWSPCPLEVDPMKLMANGGDLLRGYTYHPAFGFTNNGGRIWGAHATEWAYHFDKWFPTPKEQAEELANPTVGVAYFNGQRSLRSLTGAPRTLGRRSPGGFQPMAHPITENDKW